MKFIANPWRRVNRNWKTYIADSKWVIEADTPEIQALFKAYWFKSEEWTNTSKVKEKSLRDEYIEVFWKKPWNLSEEKMKAKILEAKQ